MGYDFEIDERSSVVHPILGGDRLRLSIDGIAVLAALEDGQIKGESFLVINGTRERVFVASSKDVHFIHLRGRTHSVTSVNALTRAQNESASSSGTDELRAPMPGVVVSVAVADGDEVSSGQVLMTIESMKLQTAIIAPHEARVSQVCLTPGSRFIQGATLIRLEARGESK